jgi:hypothetical protein
MEVLMQRCKIRVHHGINFFLCQKLEWVHCHNGMARPQFADGGDVLQFCRAAANILNKQSRTTDKG